MFIAALFKIVKTWKLPKCSSTEEQINVYLAIEEKEILPFGAIWMALEGIMLSEIVQTEKDKCCMFSLLCGDLIKVNL